MFENWKKKRAERKKNQKIEKAMRAARLDRELKAAVSAGDTSEVKRLLRKGADPNTVVSVGGRNYTMNHSLYAVAGSEIKRILESYGYSPEESEKNLRHYSSGR